MCDQTIDVVGAVDRDIEPPRAENQDPPGQRGDVPQDSGTANPTEPQEPPDTPNSEQGESSGSDGGSGLDGGSPTTRNPEVNGQVSGEIPTPSTQREGQASAQIPAPSTQRENGAASEQIPTTSGQHPAVNGPVSGQNSNQNNSKTDT